MHIRSVLVLIAALAGLVWAPGASASSVTDANIDLYQGSLTPISEVEAGSQGGLRVYFTVATETAGGNHVTITGPEGAVFAAGIGAGNNTMTDVTDNPGSFANAGLVGITDGGRTVIFEVPNSVQVEAGDVLGVNLSLIHSFITFGTNAGANVMQVSTTHDSTPVNTAQYSITAAEPVAPVAVDGDQVTAVNQAFDPLRVGLADEYGNPVAGGQVSASVPLSGPSGSFPGAQTTVNVQTGADGEAVLPTLTANGALGAWELELEGPGGLQSAFDLQNLENTGAATVSVSLAPSTVPADGTTKTTATATVTDEFGNPVPGDDVQFGSSGPQ